MFLVISLFKQKFFSEFVTLSDRMGSLCYESERDQLFG